jgi:hypothetical protein
MITNNIQQHLIGKRWSSSATTDKEVIFKFDSSGQLHLFMNGVEIGYEDYYITTSSCDSETFTDSKVGSTSSGNYIKTVRKCYVIELYSSLNKIRLKSSNTQQWQDYYLLD